MSNNTSIEKITLEMLSDWHIGTGSGIPGSVDALLSKDNDGFPQIPAKTLVGIWRDALETLTYGLDNGKGKGDWQKWVDVIFGSQPNIDKNPNEMPRPAILSIQPATINENLRKAIGENIQLRQALTFVKPNTKIDSNSGTAETDSLRFTEMGRIGSVLESEFSLNFEGFDENQTKLVKALLMASASLVERIGGNRRRGSGRCDFTVNLEISDAVTVLRKYQSESLPEIPAIQPKMELEAAQKDISDKWKRIEFSLTLHTPVAIVTATLGNVSETLDFIPGTYLLPHITKQLKGISKYVASGDFQVLPATICVEGNRGLPVPKVIHYHKTDGGFDKEKTIYNRLEEDISGGEQKKNYREGYVSSLDEKDKLPFYETTKKILLMHNTVEDEVQRPTENVGGVFSRQAIQAGQVLKGEIRYKEAIATNLDFTKIGGYVRLGTSKKDDYGLACFEVLGEPTSAKPEFKNKTLIVYLASDVLLRNDNLRQSNLVDDLKKKLEDKLETRALKSLDDFIKPLENQLSELSENEKTERDKIKSEIEKIKKEKAHLISLIQVRRIESWHEGWGFPRPTFTAMAAGSVAVFEVVETEIDPTILQNLELSGIGERRGEGYGQIRFNPQILMEKINDWSVSKKDEDKEKLKKEAQETERIEAIKKLKNQIQNATKFKKFVQNIEVTAWREELARAVLKIADNKAKRKEIFGFSVENKESFPPLSQIGNLRSAIGKLKLDGTNKDVVTGWLTHIKATNNRAEKWKKNGFGKLKDIFDENKLNEIWTILEANDTNGKPYFAKPDFITDLKSTLWAEAVKSLFDACARANKRETEDK